MDVIKIGLAITAGLGGASALVVAYRKQKTVEHTYELSRHAQRLSELSAARDLARPRDERFDMAGSQLGCQDSPAVRLSGIYSLATLADNWEDGRQQCVSVLTAYLRLPFLPGETNVGEIEVRHTVLTVIREHLRPDAVASWDGMLFDLTRRHTARRLTRWHRVETLGTQFRPVHPHRRHHDRPRRRDRWRRYQLR